jgi:tRNA(Ile)-lysidine synthase
LDKFSSSFLNKLTKTVKDSDLLAWGERVVTAVSGGIDSTVLLCSLYELRHYFGINIICASFDHKIRPSSAEDITFVKDLCKKLSIPFYTESKDIKLYAKENKLNLEEAARILRYRFLMKTAEDFKAKKIAVAHHLDDFAENLVMRLITGGGAGAISGFKVQSGIVIRPLINHSKSEITNFANKNSIKFVEDYTNADTKILRNFVRLNIMPSLKECNASFLKTVKNTAEILRKDDDFIEQIARKSFNDIVQPDANGKRIVFEKNDLLRLEDALLYRILKISVLDACGYNSKNKNEIFIKKPIVYYKNLKAFIQLMKSKKPNTYFYINSFTAVRKEYDKIIIEYIPSAKNLNFKSFNFELEEPLENPKSGLKKRYNYLIDKAAVETGRQSVNINEINKVFHLEKLSAGASDKIIKDILEKKIDFQPNIAYFDYDRISFPIIIRPFNEGDRFVPLGMKGGKKLKEYFIDKKVPVNIRKIIPVILFGGKIAWVSLNEISDDIKITELTRNAGIMRIE